VPYLTLACPLRLMMQETSGHLSTRVTRFTSFAYRQTTATRAARCWFSVGEEKDRDLKRIALAVAGTEKAKQRIERPRLPFLPRLTRMSRIVAGDAVIFCLLRS
jgi:hypothetical protein